MPAVLRAPGPTLSLTTPAGRSRLLLAVRTLPWATIKADGRRCWSAPSSTASSRIVTLGTSWSRASLYECGLLLFWRADEARTKHGTWWQYDGNIDATESLPVDPWYLMTYSWDRVTDCSDRNHEEVSMCINLYGEAGRILCENIAFEICSYPYYVEDWWLWYVFKRVFQDAILFYFNGFVYTR